MTMPSLRSAATDTQEVEVFPTSIPPRSPQTLVPPASKEKVATGVEGSPERLRNADVWVSVA
jgi:hypothetical protein